MFLRFGVNIWLLSIFWVSLTQIWVRSTGIWINSDRVLAVVEEERRAFLQAHDYFLLTSSCKHTAISCWCLLASTRMFHAHVFLFLRAYDYFLLMSSCKIKTISAAVFLQPTAISCLCLLASTRRFSADVLMQAHGYFMTMINRMDCWQSRI